MARKKAESATEKKPRARKPKSTALAEQLRGSEVVDEALVNEVVERINGVHQAKGLETARSVAETVIDVFFDGKPELFFARGKSHLSFDALKTREDLHVSYQFVWNSCAVYDQLRKLPKEVADALPLAHHKMLLGVKDEDKKRELAAEAVENSLSKRAFEERVQQVRKVQNVESNLGRPPLPAFAKAFGKLKHIVKLAESEEISEESFVHFSKEEAKELLAELDEHMGVLARVAGSIRNLAAMD